VTHIEARDLSEAWWRCMRELLLNGYDYVIDRGSFEGRKRKEFDFVVVRIEHPGNRPLIPEVPEGVPPPVSLEYVEEYLQYLMADYKAPNEDYTYGQYLEKQIQEVIKMYREGGPNTNQAFMAVGDQHSILLKDPPCLRGIDTRIRYGRLHFMVWFRSWDLWAGFPANLAGVQTLKEYMAAQIGVDDGEIIACSKGMHLYDYTWDLARQVTRV
ncbi:MAG: thymidylate synthase, partial [Chloroflexi bacterium]|nr:thymidylate synthase [Chloroflexota bacterium]